MDTYDLAIVGSGVSGSFAALKIATEHKNIKTIVFDLGVAPAKRKKQMDGFLGCLPTSDGKLFINDLSAVSEITGSRKSKSAFKWFNNYMSDIMDMKITKDRPLNASVEKRIKKNGFDIRLNDYVQMYPKDIHLLSKHISSSIFSARNMTMSFDNEVLNINKNKNSFTITSYDKQVECKRLIICTGRSGWRWTKKLYDTLGIIESNNIAKYGIRVEASISVMKDFNKSNCSIFRDNLDIGPLCWGGTIIPEDHIDFAISAFRSNENRWKSDKVSFNIIGHREYKNMGFEQTERIGQLAFVLANDRIVKEKLSLILNKKSRISIMPEYDWLINDLTSINQFMPDIISKGYFHIPTILPLIPKINIGNNLITDVDGLYCAGESAGIIGILAAATTGIISAESACK